MNSPRAEGVHRDGSISVKKIGFYDTVNTAVPHLFTPSV